MNIKLNTDWTDYYDHWFCGSWEAPDRTLDRLMRNTLSKRDQLLQLHFAGFAVPLHGPVLSVAQQVMYAQAQKPPAQLMQEAAPALVVYTDEYAHAGEGKVLLPYYHALGTYPNRYATEYIQTHTDPTIAVSTRLLYIGEQAFWLEYQAQGDWRSNCGEQVTIKECAAAFTMPRDPLFDRYPIFAVDFVRHLHTGTLLAIDLNTAPGLKNTPVETLLHSKRVYDLIEAWMMKHEC